MSVTTTPRPMRHLASWHFRGALALAVVALLSGCGQKSADALVASGREYLSKQDPRAAIIELKSALQKQPDSPEARRWLGEALLAAGDVAGAAVELERAIELGASRDAVLPTLARALLQSGQAKKLTASHATTTLASPTAQAMLKTTLAAAWLSLGDRERAAGAVDGALAAVPEHAPALVQRARIAAVEDRAADAMSSVDLALARDPASAEGWHLKGDLLATVQNDPKAASEAFRKALAVDASYVPAHLSLITLALRANDVAAAKAQAASLRAKRPGDPQTIYVDARLALVQKDIRAARDATQQLLKIAPDSGTILLLAGTVEAQGGSPILAEAYLAKALQLRQDAVGVRRQLARSQLRLGQPVKALGTLQPLLSDSTTDAEALALAGEAQLQLRDPRAAEKLYLQAARLAPSDPRPRTTLALLRLDRGEAENAFAQLEAIAAQSQDGAAEMAIVSARLKRREYDAALRALDAMERKQASGASVQELRGMVLAASGNVDAARQAFERALAAEPGRYSSIAQLAALDVRQGQRDRAAQRLTAAIKAEPRNHAARLALAEIRSSEGRPLSEIRQILADGIAAAPDEPGPRLRMIELLLSRKQVKEALSTAQEALAALPNDADVLDAVGRCQELAGDVQQAIGSFHRLAALEPRAPRAHLRLARLQSAAGQRDAAIASLQRALEIDPSQDAVQAQLVDALVIDGRPKEALDLARTLQQRRSSSPVGYLLEGLVHRRTKNLDAAVAALRAGLQAAADGGPIAIELHRTLVIAGRLAEADRFAAGWQKTHVDDLPFEYHLASTALARRELDLAEPRLRRVLEALPNHVLALNNYAWLLVQKQRPGAVPLAQKAVDLQPNQPALMDTLASALAAEGQAARALDLQKRVVELAPGDMPMRVNLARIALKAGDRSLARSELDRLAALGTKLPQHAEVEALRRSL